MLRHLIIAGTLIALPELNARTLIQPPPQSDRDEEETYVGEMPDRHAQVKLLEGQVTIRKGDDSEPLERGVPVSEGDVVESRGRGVLQLADGTRLAFGEDTRFTVLSLFESKKGVQQVVLRLDQGRLRVQVGREDETSVRIDTPNGKLQLGNRDDVSVEMERDRTLRVKVFQGRARLANREDRVTLGAGERLTAYSDSESLNRIRDFNTYEVDGFERWATDSLRGRRSESASRVPREIRNYVDDLDGNGEWIRVDDVSDWVWRPRVSVEWRPYWQGRWGAYSGGMTWVSAEPWGYVTHHHGRWGWSSRYGWYWIPGAYYAPAWVAWSWTDAHMGWAPLGYWNAPVSWGWGAWNGGYCWNIVPRHQINIIHINNYVIHDNRTIVDFRARVSVVDHDRTRRNFWQQTPLVVRSNEFRSPDRMSSVLRPDIQRTRLGEFRQSAPERVVIQRTPVDRGGSPGLDRTPVDRAGGPSVDRTPRPSEPARTPFTQLGSRELDRRRDGRVDAVLPVRPTESRPEPRPDRGTLRGSETAAPPRGTEAPSRELRPIDRRPDPRESMSPVMPPRNAEPRRTEPEGRDAAPRIERRDERREERREPTPQPRFERREERREPTPQPPPRIERREERREPTPPPAPRVERREERRESAPPPRVERRESAPPPRAERREERRER